MGKKKRKQASKKTIQPARDMEVNRAFEAAGLGHPGVRRMKRIMSLYDDICNGLTNQTQMAHRYGVSTKQITEDMEFVWALFSHDTLQEVDHLRTVALARLEKVIRDATTSFEDSRQTRETIITEYKQVMCPMCKGTGESADEGTCEECEGRGRIHQEHRRRKVEGQSGHPHFLREIRNAVELQCKILGVIHGKREYHLHNHDERSLNIDISNVNPETVLEAMRVDEKLRLEAEGGTAGNQDAAK